MGKLILTEMKYTLAVAALLGLMSVEQTNALVSVSHNQSLLQQAMREESESESEADEKEDAEEEDSDSSDDSSESEDEADVQMNAEPAEEEVDHSGEVFTAQD